MVSKIKLAKKIGRTFPIKYHRCCDKDLLNFTVCDTCGACDGKKVDDDLLLLLLPILF